jgi:hypothetical protein
MPSVFVHRVDGSSAARLVAVSFVVASLVACAHAPSTPDPVRELRVLDASFASFTAGRLHGVDDAETAVARLESIRLDWLAVLGADDGVARGDDGVARGDEGTLALLRLAELHLDLAARIRRIPYPAGVDDNERRAFDAMLSRLALPLEATGQGVLAQITARAARGGGDGRFVRRARLYQRLHGGHPLGADDVRVLTAELEATTFRAPTTLLQAGRIGQRASR